MMTMTKLGTYRRNACGTGREAEQFYRPLSGPARVGMEACGQYPWFERLLHRRLGAQASRWPKSQGAAS
jgi:hypothetical protein